MMIIIGIPDSAFWVTIYLILVVW